MMDEAERHRQMIIEACDRNGIVPREDEWSHDADNERPVLTLGRWAVVVDDDERGLYEGDSGTLRANVVGAQEYNNEQVKFYFHNDEMDDEAGEQVIPFEDVTPL